MKAIVKNWIEENNLIESGDTIICAVSGGVDSIVLLHMLNSMKSELDIKIKAAHFNHHIRGNESDRDMEFTREFCKSLGIEFFEGHGEVIKRASEMKESVEEAARFLRYQFLESIDKDAKIATAHHSNDNIETILIKLIRGCGQNGVSGIPPRRGNIIRPLLCLSRENIVEYANINGLKHVEDSTNNCDDYLRNRIRHNIIPMLLNENPNLLNNVLNTAQLIRKDNEYLNNVADKSFNDLSTNKGYNIEAIKHLDDAIRLRVIKKILITNYVNYNGKLINYINDTINSDKSKVKIDIPGEKVLIIKNGYLNILDKSRIDNSRYTLKLEDSGVYSISNGNDIEYNNNKICTEISKNPTDLMINKDSIKGDLFIRNRIDGDKIKLPCGTKSIGRWLKERNVSDYDKGKYSVICDESSVVAVLGIGVNMFNRVNLGDNIVEIKLIKDW